MTNHQDATRIRELAIREVAEKYHGEMAKFYRSRGQKEMLAGIAERDFKAADRHDVYKKEILEQVWLKDALTKSAIAQKGEE